MHNMNMSFFDFLAHAWIGTVLLKFCRPMLNFSNLSVPSGPQIRFYGEPPRLRQYIYMYIYMIYILLYTVCALCAFPWSLFSCFFPNFLCMGEMPGLWYFHMLQTHTRAYSPHVPPAEQDITKFPCWYMRLLTIPYNIDSPRWRLSNGDFIVSRCLRADASCKFLQCPISFTFLRNQWPGRSTKDAAGAEFRLDWSWRSRSFRLCRWDHSLICL